jgi:hypothetical protein
MIIPIIMVDESHKNIVSNLKRLLLHQSRHRSRASQLKKPYTKKARLHALHRTLMMIDNKIPNNIPPKNLVLLLGRRIKMSDAVVTMGDRRSHSGVVESARQSRRPSINNVEAMRHPSSRIELKVGHGGGRR